MKIRLLVLLLLPGLTGARGAESPSPPVLRMVVENNSAPFSFHDKSDRPTGFVNELITAIATAQ